GAEAKSLELGQAYQAVAERQGVYFLDAGQHIRSDDADGIHLDAQAHITLGKAVAQTVLSIFAAT
ncbi:MAG: hydrolase, partial [Phototrophicales bacterium]